MNKETVYLTDAQLKNEVARCEYCEEKGCKDACPADCSPTYFIKAISTGEKYDYKRAAAEILEKNPFGLICGLVCPDRHCMSGCTHKDFDGSLNIPAIQATIIKKAKELKAMPEFQKVKTNGKKVAVIGAGAAGLSAAAYLGQKGFKVDVYEERAQAGGVCNLIPDYRLPKDALKTNINFVLSLSNITLKLKTKADAQKLASKYDAVITAAGLWEPFKLNIPGEKKAVYSLDFLSMPKNYKVKGKKIAVIGGAATAVDCALTAQKLGADVEMFSLETLGEMVLTNKEFDELIQSGINVNGRTALTEIVSDSKKITALKVNKMKLNGKKFLLKNLSAVKGSEICLPGFDMVIIAIGNRPGIKQIKNSKIFYAGDCANGPTTVVEAAAAGKNTAALVEAKLKRNPAPKIKDNVKSALTVFGYNKKPVDLTTNFFGRKIISPFLLSAAPPSDGFDQMKKAYEAGWAGGIMKTAFDGADIHIPGEYMYSYSKETYANCDNVSGHSLSRVCKEIGKLRKLFPDRLTIGSTGGPVTGNDKNDRKGWQANTKKLENAGAMGVEYSLSCPQGGDGTEGDIVSQNAELTAKIIDWILEASDPKVPKLFKLTAAVTSIEVIIKAIKEVLLKHPRKKAGVTLANTFPTLAFRKITKKKWEDGVIVGMSGEGALPISYLTLSKACPLGVEISGNGGPMNYKAAADFLALGVNNVQFCTIVMKDGVNVIQELEEGISHLMAERKIKSIDALRGIALPNPVTDFMDLPAKKKISAVDADLCEHCGNCARCPYLAIKLNNDKVPETDASKCVGCSICVQKCFSGALYMRERTPKEMKLLKED